MKKVQVILFCQANKFSIFVILILELCVFVTGRGWRRIDGIEHQLPEDVVQSDRQEGHPHKYKTYIDSNIPRAYRPPKLDIQHLVDNNPVAATLLLGSLLHLPAGYSVANHPELLPVNPFLALLLSQYGRYLPPHGGGGRGLYGHAAANNYHNNKPFGAYKIYEDGEKR